MSLLTFERNLLLKQSKLFISSIVGRALCIPIFDHKLAYTEFDELNHNYEEMQRLIETLKEDENEKEFVESLEKSNKLIEAILHAKTQGMSSKWSKQLIIMKRYTGSTDFWSKTRNSNH